MPKKFQWFIRFVFILYMTYIYFTVVQKNYFYSFLFLNTFLGYIPIELAFHVNHKQNKYIFYFIFLLWLLFYPNAPYVLTDLFHLARYNPYDPKTGLMTFNLHMWLSYTNLLSSALACSLLGIWSLEYFTNVIMQRFNLHHFLTKFSLIIIFNIISSIGIYVGRFLRLHSAYIFIKPAWVINELLSMWNLRMLIFIGFLTLIQLIIWIISYIVRISLNNSQFSLQN